MITLTDIELKGIDDALKQSLPEPRPPKTSQKRKVRNEPVFNLCRYMKDTALGDTCLDRDLNRFRPVVSDWYSRLDNSWKQPYDEDDEDMSQEGFWNEFCYVYDSVKVGKRKNTLMNANDKAKELITNRQFSKRALMYSGYKTQCLMTLMECLAEEADPENKREFYMSSRKAEEFLKSINVKMNFRQVCIVANRFTVDKLLIVVSKGWSPKDATKDVKTKDRQATHYRFLPFGT